MGVYYKNIIHLCNKNIHYAKDFFSKKVWLIAIFKGFFRKKLRLILFKKNLYFFQKLAIFSWHWYSMCDKIDSIIFNCRAGVTENIDWVKRDACVKKTVAQLFGKVSASVEVRQKSIKNYETFLGGFKYDE